MTAPPSWTSTAGFLGLAAALGLGTYIVQALLVGAFKRASKNTASKWDDALFHLLDPALPLASGVLVMGLAFEAARENLEPSAQTWGGATVIAGWLLLAALMLARVLGSLSNREVVRHPQREPMIRLLHRSLLGAVYAVAVLVLLQSLGVQITPVLASLGIGGIAIALALQDSLANLFAGIWMRSTRDMRPGHYIRVEDTGLEGHVVKMGWRTTRLRARSKNLLIVPNSLLSRSAITNFHLPEPRTTISMVLAVGFESDPDQVASILVDETVAAASAVQGLLPEPKPTARLALGPKGLEFTVRCHVVDISLQNQARDAILRRVVARFRAENIRIAER